LSIGINQDLSSLGASVLFSCYGNTFTSPFLALRERQSVKKVTLIVNGIGEMTMVSTPLAVGR
jgi:hypothetical protein